LQIPPYYARLPRIFLIVVWIKGIQLIKNCYIRLCRGGAWVYLQKPCRRCCRKGFLKGEIRFATKRTTRNGGTVGNVPRYCITDRATRQSGVSNCLCLFSMRIHKYTHLASNDHTLHITHHTLLAPQGLTPICHAFFDSFCFDMIETQTLFVYGLRDSSVNWVEHRMSDSS
jgi:hypothetical protein